MNIEKPPGLTCRICGHWEQKSLNNHLKAKHGLRTTEYKLQFPKAKTMTGHSKRTVDYWVLKGYTVLEAQQQVKNFQSQGKQQFMQKKVQEGWTEVQAQVEWNKKQAKNSKRALEYWTSRGFTEQEARNFQTAEQSKHSAKSAKFTGKQHSVESRQKISQTMQKHVERSGAKEWVRKFYKGKVGHQSTGEIQCYQELQKQLPGLEANKAIGSYIVDMICGTLIIEYYGDFWHANPQIYKQETLPIIGSVKKVHSRDEKRIEKFAELGYKTYIIWEANWKKDKSGELEKIKQHISYENRNTNTDTEN